MPEDQDLSGAESVVVRNQEGAREMRTSKLLLALTLILALSLTAAIWFFPPNGDFRVDNPFWNGFSTIDAKMKATTIGTLDSLPSNPSGTALLTSAL